jgi:hypothetical protein
VRDLAEFRAATWRDSSSVCALADGQRHLGHVVRAGNCWLAFDATRSNSTGTGFRLIGSWMNVAVAKRALEQVLISDCSPVSRLQ